MIRRLIILLLIVGCEDSISVSNSIHENTLELEYTESFSCIYHINYYEPISGVLFPINSWDWDFNSLKFAYETLDIF